MVFLAGGLSVGRLSLAETENQVLAQFRTAGPGWTQSQKVHLLKNFIKNEDGTYSGAVWASPSSGRPPKGDDPGEPDYRFHWIRDSAIATKAVADLFTSAEASAEDKGEYAAIMKSFVRFSADVQNLPGKWDWMIFDNGNWREVAEGTPGAVAMRFGEPKYRVVKKNGKWVPAVFEEPWGRPQNDGPALRAITMGRIIRSLKTKVLLTEDDRKTIDLAVEVMKKDLSYVQHRWRDSSYDLWEEVLGDHFFTRVMQSEGLRRSAEILKEMGDPSHQTFGKIAEEIDRTLDAFWDPTKGHITATRNIRGGMRKDTDIDMAIIQAALYRQNGSFSATDDRVLATAMELYETFKNDPAFAMNRIAGLPGIAIGRYPKDPWTGERRLQNPDGSPISAGHPWIITTLAMSELFYRLAGEWREAGVITVTPLNRKFLEFVLDGPLGSETEITRKGSHARFEAVLNGLRKQGTFTAARLVAAGVQPHSFTAEQFAGYPGAPIQQIGATGLTWNCAAYFSIVKRFRLLSGKPW